MTFLRWKAIDAVLRPGEELSSVERFVLVDLVRRCGPTGECFPSLASIAAATGLSRRAVYRALGKLESDPCCPLALERVRRRQSGASLNDCTLYRLAIRSRDSQSPRVGTHSPHVGTEGHGGRDSEAQGRDSQSPDPLMNPPGNPWGESERERDATGPGAQDAVPSLRSRKQMGVPLPSDFAPTSEHFDLGAQLGLSRDQVSAKASAFQDHARDTGRTSSDWSAAFRNWIRREPSQKRSSKPSVKPAQPRASGRRAMVQPGPFVDNSIPVESLPPVRSRA